MEGIVKNLSTATMSYTLGVSGSSINNGPGTMNSAIGTQGAVSNYQNTGNITAAQAGFFQVVNSGTGSIASGVAGQFLIKNVGAGTINTGYGVNVSFDNTGPTPITTGYGVFISNILATNKWSVFAADSTAPSYFAGSVGIGTTTPAQKLGVYGNIAINGTSICTSSGCTSSSDRALKENIQPLQHSLEKVLKLQAVEYDYKDKTKFTDRHQVGVIAQDVEDVYPEVVLKDPKTGLRSVAYDHLVAPLIEALKSLYHRVVDIESHQTAQDREIATMKAQTASKSEAEALRTDNAQMKADNAKLKQENATIVAYLCSKDQAAPFCK